MSFEYFIDMGCPVQGPRTPVEFMRRAKTYHSGMMLEQLRQETGESPREFSEKTVNMAFPTPTLLGSKQELKMSELMDMAHRIARKAEPHCRDCPARIDGTLLGCHGAIKYPFTPRAEQWLMARFAPPDGANGYIPHHIDESGVTGEGFDRMRGVPDTPGRITLAHANVKATKRIDAGKEYSFSQVFEYLLACQPTLLNITLFGLCVDFGAVKFDRDELPMIVSMIFMGNVTGKDMLADTRAKLERERPFLMASEPGDDETIDGMKRFFFACWKAFLLDRPLRIDG